MVFSLIIVLVFTTGCIDNNEKSPENKSEIALEDIVLNVDDLPSGYRIITVDRNISTQFGFSQISEVEEVIGIIFMHENNTNASGVPLISMAIARYSDYIDAVLALTNSSEIMDSSLKTIFNIVGKPIEVSLGDSSKGMYYNGQLNENYSNATSAWSYLYVKINKTLFFIALNELEPIDFPYEEKTISYMQIMVDRYNSS